MEEYNWIIHKSKLSDLGLTVALSRFYHGDGQDQTGQVGKFLSGQGRYSVLWETTNGDGNDLIADGFGPISGLSRSSIEEVICCPTLLGKKKFNDFKDNDFIKLELR